MRQLRLRTWGTLHVLALRLRRSSLGLYNLIFLHCLPNSHGWVADAASDLHENLLDGVFSLHALGGHGGAASVLGDTGSVAFSRTDSSIHGSLVNSSSHPIHACAHSCFDGCRAGFGVCGRGGRRGGCARAPVSFLSDVPDVPDDEDDACMDGNNSVIQDSGVMQLHVHVWMPCRIHAGLVVTVFGEEQSVRVQVLGTRFGFLMGLRVPSLIRSQKSCMLRRGLVHKEVSLRRFPWSRSMELGMLRCPLPLILISLLCYLGQAVKLEGIWGGHRWRKLTGLECGFSGVPFKERIFFLPLPYLVTGLGRGRTTQHGRSLGIPCARAHMRIGTVQLSGHTRGSSVGNCSRGCGGLSLP